MSKENTNSGKVAAFGENASAHGTTFIENNYYNQATYTALHQLPPPSADFVGREKEMAELLQALESGGVTISGLQGMGGIGKTALALKLADQLKPKYPDAQFYIDLKGASKEPLSAKDAMIHVIHSYHPEAILPEDENSLRGLYNSLLEGKKALLLLDNAASAEQVRPLIPPDGSILIVTSRNLFKLSGFFVKNLDTLTPNVAKQLLLKIAPRIGKCAEKIAELCDYLPLALEVAASAMHKAVNLTPDAYVMRLTKATKRLELVEASLSLSYELLSDELKKLWRVLSVLPNTFDDKAVAALWALSVEDTQDRLAELISYSLIEWNETTQRYRLHDLVHLFADTRLDEQERHSAKKAHAIYFKNLLAQTHQHYLRGGEEMIKGLALFDIESENIKAGQAWAASFIGQDDTATSLSLEYYNVGANVLNLRIHPRESINWLETVLKAARLLKHKEAEGATLGNLGVFNKNIGDISKAINLHEQALLIAREIGHRRSEGTAIGNLGTAYAELGEIAKAIEYFEEHLKISCDLGDQLGKSTALGNLGNSYAELNEIGKAIEFHNEQLKVSRRMGDRKGESIALNNIGVAYSALGDLLKAIEFYKQRLEIACEIGDLRGEGMALWNIAVAYYDLGDHTQAINFAELSLPIYEQIESPSVPIVRSAIAQWEAEMPSKFSLLKFLKSLFS